MAPHGEVSDRTFVVWLDPGKVTGVACYDLEDAWFHSTQKELADLRLYFSEALLPAYGDVMTIGWEMFINTSGGARTGDPSFSNEAIGLVRSLAQEHGIPLLKPQPSSARKLGNPVMLRRLGWYKPGKGHANDAAQHLLADLLKRHPMPHAIRAKLFPGYTGRGNLAT